MSDPGTPRPMPCFSCGYVLDPVVPRIPPAEGSPLMCMNCGFVRVMRAGKIVSPRPRDVARWDAETLDRIRALDARRRTTPFGDLREARA